MVMNGLELDQNLKKKIKELDNKEILVQGYMFPLDQDEKQKFVFYWVLFH